MSDAYLGEIRMFAGNFAPQGWAFCEGQLLAISQNTALFSILGTIYGGNGVSTFALPNLVGSAPMHAGEGPGLTSRTVGESVGEDAVTLTVSRMPTHSHQAVGLASTGNTKQIGGSVFAENPAPEPHRPGNPLYTSLPTGAMSSSALSDSGSGQAHNNRQPSVGLSFIIALVGEYPSRS